MIDSEPLALKEWKPGDRLEAREFDVTNRAVERLYNTVNPGKQIVGSVAGSKPAQFKLVSVAGDYVVCNTFDGTATGTVQIAIAKPYLLRRSIATRGSITYTYTSDTFRNADNGEFSENQIVIPDYAVGDLIFATRVLRGTGVDWEPTAGATESVIWLDLNVDARAWAKQATA